MERTQAQTVRLVTLNTFAIPFVRYTRSRLATIARELNRVDLDVLCFQEVHLTRYIPILLHRLSHFPHHDFEPFIYAPKGGLLTISRYPVHRRRFVLYERRGRMHSPALADWLLHKGILVGEFRAGDMPVAVVNTHLVANYSADWSPRAHYAVHQRAELEQLRRALEEIAPDRLVIVAGDFNIPTEESLFQEFARAAGLAEVRPAGSEPTFRPPIYFPSHYARSLDHILVRAPNGRNVDATSRLVLNERIKLENGSRNYVSDHSGIEAEITVSQN